MRNGSLVPFLGVFLGGALATSAPAFAQTPAADPAPATTPPAASPPSAAPAAETPPASAPAEATPAPAAPAASAQPTSEEKPKTETLQPLPQNMQIQVPTVPPAMDFTYHVHRGFYLGVNAGVGDNSGSYDDNHQNGQRLNAEGFNLAMDLLVGYAGSPGVAFGGALMTDMLPSAHFARAGLRESSGSSMSFLLGPFVDGFPDAKGPLHLGGTIGLSHVAAMKAAFDHSDINSTGVGFASWIGYMPWVGEHFSFGASLRVMVDFTGIGQDRGAATRSFNLVVNALSF
jgi:hypothetical protein